VNVFTRTAVVLVAAAAPTLGAALPAGAAGSVAVPASHHCCDGGDWGNGDWRGDWGGRDSTGWSPACNGMVYRHGQWYDTCGDALASDPNSFSDPPRG